MPNLAMQPMPCVHNLKLWVELAEESLGNDNERGRGEDSLILVLLDET
jgi:hypothetical protein